MTLRPIQYLGNKSQVLEPIVSLLNSISPEGKTVIDLFAGTGVVTRALANTRDVLSSDIQSYSAILSRALCQPRNYGVNAIENIILDARSWLTELAQPVHNLISFETEALQRAQHEPNDFVSLVEEGSFLYTGSSNPRLSFIKNEASDALIAAGARLTYHYGGAYFSYRQALELDSLINAIGHRPNMPAEDTLVSALLSTASDSASTVGGHFAQPMRLRNKEGIPKISSILQSERIRQISVFDSFQNWLQRYGRLTPAKMHCSAITSDYRDVLATQNVNVGAIYADPPYTRDHYSRFYHLLETIAIGDDPGVALTPGTDSPTRGLYRNSRHQSPFSIRTKAPRAFAELYERASNLGVPLVLSYSPQGGGTAARPQTRLMSIDQISNLAQSYYSQVEILPIANSTHSRFNLSRLHGTVPNEAEILIFAQP